MSLTNETSVRVAEEWWDENSGRFINKDDWWDMGTVLAAYSEQRYAAGMARMREMAAATLENFSAAGLESVMYKLAAIKAIRALPAAPGAEGEKAK